MTNFIELREGEGRMITRVGYLDGVRELRAFASGTADCLRERDAVVENVALTLAPTRTVEEVVVKPPGRRRRTVGAARGYRERPQPRSHAEGDTCLP